MINEVKVRLIGNDGEKIKLMNVVNNLNYNFDIELVPDKYKFKYNIKYTPALIIDNVVIADVDKLTASELHEVLSQFVE